jgi:hypothetical protein
MLTETVRKLPNLGLIYWLGLSDWMGLSDWTSLNLPSSDHSKWIDPLCCPALSSYYLRQLIFGANLAADFTLVDRAFFELCRDRDEMGFVC